MRWTPPHEIRRQKSHRGTSIDRALRSMKPLAVKPMAVTRAQKPGSSRMPPRSTSRMVKPGRPCIAGSSRSGSRARAAQGLANQHHAAERDEQAYDPEEHEGGVGARRARFRHYEENGANAGEQQNEAENDHNGGQDGVAAHGRLPFGYSCRLETMRRPATMSQMPPPEIARQAIPIAIRPGSPRPPKRLMATIAHKPGSSSTTPTMIMSTLSARSRGVGLDSFCGG